MSFDLDNNNPHFSSSVLLLLCELTAALVREAIPYLTIVSNTSASARPSGAAIRVRIADTLELLCVDRLKEVARSPWLLE